MLQSITTRSALISFEQLLRLRLAATVTASAAAGYLAALPPLDLAPLLSLVWGVLLLTTACSALNQVQERDVDARMVRTRERPVAAGRLSAGAALAIAGCLGCTGLLLLFSVDPRAAALGAGAAAWYHVVYTPLKRVSPWAIPLGAVCGALPPLMGWSAAGGLLRDPAILNLALIFVLWQVPHFWMLALPDREDYRRAGLHVLPSRWSISLLRRMAGTWTLGLAAITALLPLAGLLSTTAGRVACSGLGAWLLLAAMGGGDRLGGRLTRFICLLILLLTADALLGRLSGFN